MVRATVDVCRECGRTIQSDKGSDRVLKLMTPRQLQVMARVAEGLTDREIASVLGITYLTVKDYRRSVRDITGMSSGVELANFFWSHPALVRAAGAVEK